MSMFVAIVDYKHVQVFSFAKQMKHDNDLSNDKINVLFVFHIDRNGSLSSINVPNVAPIEFYNDWNILQMQCDIYAG